MSRSKKILDVPKRIREKLKDFYYNNNYVTACSYCNGRDYTTSIVDAAVQVVKPLTYTKQTATNIQ